MKNTKENNAKPKLRKALAVLIGILLFWNVIVRYLGYGLYARLYFLPRLSVSVNLTVDGEACRLERGEYRLHIPHKGRCIRLAAV